MREEITAKKQTKGIENRLQQFKKKRKNCKTNNIFCFFAKFNFETFVEFQI